MPSGDNAETALMEIQRPLRRNGTFCHVTKSCDLIDGKAHTESAAAKGWHDPLSASPTFQEVLAKPEVTGREISSLALTIPTGNAVVAKVTLSPR